MAPRVPRIPAHLPLLAALVLLTGAAYWAGLPGTFVLDDAVNITDNPDVAVTSLDAASVKGVLYAALEPWPSRGLARLSFALNYLASGGRFDPGAFKVTNIAIHLVNGVLVYLLLMLALRARHGSDEGPVPSRLLAVLAAGIWLLHPLQLTAVLYAVQRMTSLAALFTLLGLVIYCTGRSRLAARPLPALALMALGVVGGTGLGTLCKENAILTPAFALLLELWFFSLPGRTTAGERRWLAGFHSLTVVVPGLLGLGLLVLYSDRFLEAYAFRDFGLSERVLTEARVLGHYVRWFVLPLIRDLSLFHDDIPISTGLFSPWSTAVAVAAWTGLGVAAVVTFPRRPVAVFCALWFVTGHLLESTVLPLEIAFEHRNYVPLVGLCLAPAALAGWLLRRRAVAPRAVLLLSGAVMVLLAFVTHTRAGIWRDPITLSYFLARNHPGSHRAQMEHARLLVAHSADEREAYAALTRASTQRAQPVLTLAEMIKAVTAIEQRLRRDATPALDPPPAAPTGIDAALLFDASYLRQLRAVLTAELERRLRLQPLSYENARALEIMRDCVLSGMPQCVALSDRVLHWLRIAMNNPRAIPATLAIANHSYGALLADSERFDEAASHAGRAWAFMPGDLGYGYYQAIYLMRAGRLDEAAAVVARMEAVHARTGLRGDVVRNLRAVYDDAMKLRDEYERGRRGAQRAPRASPATAP